MPKQHVYMKFILRLALLAVVVLLIGCDPHAILEKRVKCVTNAFRLKYAKSCDKILSVSISTQGTNVWEIRATKDIPAKGFIVSVGEVPEGFEQIVPVSPERFQPVRGTRYAIFIKTSLNTGPNASVHRVPFFWIAE
jgi:hypothetical protein